MADPRYIPGPTGPIAWLRAVVYYLYIALATIVMGVWGLWLTGRHGYEGVHRLATVWTGHLLAAARVILGLSYEIRGTPPTGDCLIGAKHQSFFDILIIAHHAPHRSFIMKKEILRIPIMGYYTGKAGCVPIDRARGGEAMTHMLSQLREIRAAHDQVQLVIYPEGTRVPPGEARRYKPGIARIYGETDLPVVPVAVNVGLFWGKRGIPMRPGHAIVEYLPAIAPGLPPDELLRELQTRVEAGSNALMSEAGFQP